LTPLQKFLQDIKKISSEDIFYVEKFLAVVLPDIFQYCVISNTKLAWAFHWNKSYQRLRHRPNSNQLAYFLQALGILNCEVEKMDTIDTGFVSHMFPRFSPSGDKIYCIAGSTTRPYCVIEVHVESKHVVIIKDTKHHEVDPGYISEPKAVTYPTEDNKVAHGYLYLPKVS
jgi:dipeptidyl aminopeptidase/acylaminoacyl peptidase